MNEKRDIYTPNTNTLSFCGSNVHGMILKALLEGSENFWKQKGTFVRDATATKFAAIGLVNYFFYQTYCLFSCKHDMREDSVHHCMHTPRHATYTHTRTHAHAHTNIKHMCVPAAHVRVLLSCMSTRVCIYYSKLLTETASDDESNSLFTAKSATAGSCVRRALRF